MLFRSNAIGPSDKPYFKQSMWDLYKSRAPWLLFSSCSSLFSTLVEVRFPCGHTSSFIKYLDKFSGDDLLVAPSVMGTLGNCYAQTGQLDKAAATLLKAADRANSLSISPIFLIQAGQILEKQGKNAEAVEAYKQVKNKYGNSYQAMDIDKYIERASLK